MELVLTFLIIILLNLGLNNNPESKILWWLVIIIFIIGAFAFSILIVYFTNMIPLISEFTL